MDDLIERLRIGIHTSVDESAILKEAANEIERLRTVTANAKDELSRLRKAQEAHEETATKLNSYINLAGDQIDEIQKLKDILHNSGIVEIAAHNNRVTEYMFHWEGRALEAEAEVERLRKMVKDAYNAGFTEGMKEVTSSRGGIPWSDCKFRKEVE